VHTDRESKDKPDFNAWIQQLKAAGFTTEDRGAARVLIQKYGCGAVVERSASGEPRFAEWPGLLTDNHVAHLVDQGFQKFWQTDDRQFPALAAELKAVHNFDGELRALLGQTSLYNEALGTVSSRYVYDRVEGRGEPKHHQPFD